MAETENRYFQLMRILFISFHLYNTTARAHGSRKLIQALLDQGAEATTVSSLKPWSQPLESESPHRLAVKEEIFIPVDASRQSRERQYSGRLGNLIKRIRRVLRRMEMRFTVLPKEDMAWANRAIRELTQRFGPDDFDVIFSLLNPPESHVVGQALKKAWGIPWVSFYSDPWPRYAYPGGYEQPISPAVDASQGKLMISFLEDTDFVLGPCERMLDQIARHFPTLKTTPKGLFPHLVYLQAPVEVAEQGPLRFVHAGAFHAQRGLDALMEGLSALLRDKPNLRGNIILEFYGAIHDHAWESKAESLGVRDAMVFKGRQDYAEMQRTLGHSPILLLCEADLSEGIFFPSKLSDYMGAQRPILAISPNPGTARDILGEYGIFAMPGDTASIQQALSEAYSLWETQRLHERILPPQQIAPLLPHEVAQKTIKAINGLLSK